MWPTWHTLVQNVGMNSMINYTIPTVKQLREQTEHGNHKCEVVSLFAGGGGSSTGYRMAGAKVLAINEFIPEAVRTYRSNWPNTHVIDCDIRKLTATEILSVIDKAKGELDILDGSPPCSAFSTFGKRDKSWGKVKKYSDSQQENVEDLFFEYIRILRGVMPKVFIAENVAGLARGVAKGYLNQILRELRLSGYYVECKILDAKYLGVPQSRNRTIFIGVRNDLMRPQFTGRLHPTPHKNIVPLTVAFKGLKFREQDKADTDLSRFKIYWMLSELRPGEQHQKLFSLMKSHPKRVSQCITATTGCISAGAPRHWDNRAFTVAETKRIMSIPDDYVLTGTYQQRIERLGRMVTPFMMRAVVENLLRLGVFNGHS